MLFINLLSFVSKSSILLKNIAGLRNCNVFQPPTIFSFTKTGIVT